jgi:uncharacterized protein
VVQEDAEVAEQNALYLQGCALFDSGQYYEAHDVWEELWTDYRGPLREYFKGLIQTSVAIYHLQCGNGHGAAKLYHSSRAYLSPYRPRRLGADLDALFWQVERCFAKLWSPSGGSPQAWFNPALAPRLSVDPSSVTVAAWNSHPETAC